MKHPEKPLITLLAAVLLLSGCAASGGNTGNTDGQSLNPLFPIQQPIQSQDIPQTPTVPQSQDIPQTPTVPQPQETPQTPTAPQPQDGSPAASFIGTWVHTYEYFDVTYHTTLVIDQNGTAAYYNEEAELGNFTATWQLSGNSLYVSRSDGVQSVLTINGSTLTETGYEDGQAYEAEYYRA